MGGGTGASGGGDDRNRTNGKSRPSYATYDEHGDNNDGEISGAIVPDQEDSSRSCGASIAAPTSDQYPGHRVVKRYIFDDANTSSVVSFNIDDGGGIGNGVDAPMAPSSSHAASSSFHSRSDSSVSSAGGRAGVGSVRHTSPSSSSSVSVISSHNASSTLPGAIHAGSGGGEGHVVVVVDDEDVDEVHAPPRRRTTSSDPDNIDGLASMTIRPAGTRERQVSNCSEGGTPLASDIMAQSGLFIDPTTIDYSTIIDLNDAEAGYIMTTTEAGSGNPNPELMSSMTQKQPIPGVGDVLGGRGIDLLFPPPSSSDAGITSEVFASEIMIQTGLLVDPTTIDYSTTTALLVAEEAAADMEVEMDERIIDTTEGMELELVIATNAGPLPTIEEQPESVGGTMTSETFLGAVNLMAIRSESFSSNDDDTLEDDEHLLFSPHGLAVDCEFTLHSRTHTLLEMLRSEVVSAVDGVDDMMCSAISRISSDIADGSVSPPPLDWIGGEDLGSIEACCLCNAFVWDRKKDATSG